MSDEFPMEVGEARRRFEKLLAMRGYSDQYSFGWRVKGKNIKSIYYLHPIPCLKSDEMILRGLLWPEGDKWYASLSLKVGKQGEMIISGGELKRVEKQTWSPPPFSKYKKTIEKDRQLILNWDLTPIGNEDVIVLNQLADWYDRRGDEKKRVEVMNGLARGELVDATISEALSITQYRWARGRTERMETALIWREHFS